MRAVVSMVKVKSIALKLIQASKCGPRSLITHQFMPFVLRPMAKKLQSVDTMAKSDFFPLLQVNLNVVVDCSDSEKLSPK